MPGTKYALPLICLALVAPVAMAQTVATPETPATSATPATAATPTTTATPTPPPATEPAPIAAASAPAAPVPACELHVWPAAFVSARTQGVAAGFGVVGALVDSAAHADQNKRDTAFITGTLDAQAQAQVLRELDLPTRLHLPPSQVIFHDQVDVKREGSQRLTNSTAQCYTEFVVRGLSYFQAVLYSGQMRTFLEVRRFDGATVKVDFRDSKHEDLAVKLPKDGDDTGPATDALLTAFRGAVVFFSDKYARKFP